MGVPIPTLNGRACFEYTYQTLASSLISDKIDEAIPEHKDFPENSQLATWYSNFKLIYPLARGVSVVLNQDAMDEPLSAFQAWWDFAMQNPTDYRAIWDRFTTVVSYVLHDAWVNGFVGSVKTYMNAPDVLRPGAPPDEQLDPNA